MWLQTLSIKVWVLVKVQCCMKMALELPHVWVDQYWSNSTGQTVLVKRSLCAYPPHHSCAPGCTGLVVRGRHVLSLAPADAADQRRRTAQQLLNDPPVMLYGTNADLQAAGGLQRYVCIALPHTRFDQHICVIVMCVHCYFAKPTNIKRNR